MRDAIYRVIQVYGNTDPLSNGKRTILDRNILYGVIQKRFGSRRSKSRVQNDLRFHDAPLRRLTSKLPLAPAEARSARIESEPHRVPSRPDHLRRARADLPPFQRQPGPRCTTAVPDTGLLQRTSRRSFRSIPVMRDPEFRLRECDRSGSLTLRQV